MKPTIEISSGFYILSAASILLLPIRLPAAAFLAAAVHELSHLFALYCCGIPVYRVRIGCQGARIDTQEISPPQELLCAAAGPLGSFSLLIFLRLFPGAALFGLVQGIYNLLPLYPMDGGRMVRAILVMLFPQRGEIAADCLGWAFLCGCFAICLRLFGLKTAIATLLIPVATRIIRKIPCKDGAKQVQ